MWQYLLPTLIAAIVWLIGLLFTLALCKAAGNADRRLAEMHRREGLL